MQAKDGFSESSCFQAFFSHFCMRCSWNSHQTLNMLEYDVSQARPYKTRVLSFQKCGAEWMPTIESKFRTCLWQRYVLKEWEPIARWRRRRLCLRTCHRRRQLWLTRSDAAIDCIKGQRVRIQRVNVNVWEFEEGDLTRGGAVVETKRQFWRRWLVSYCYDWRVPTMRPSQFKVLETR